jgi:hypothetical protein
MFFVMFFVQLRIAPQATKREPVGGEHDVGPNRRPGRASSIRFQSSPFGVHKRPPPAAEAATPRRSGRHATEVRAPPVVATQRRTLAKRGDRFGDDGVGLSTGCAVGAFERDEEQYVILGYYSFSYVLLNNCVAVHIQRVQLHTQQHHQRNKKRSPSVNAQTAPNSNNFAVALGY